MLEKLAVNTIRDKQVPETEVERYLQILDERFLDSHGYAIMQCKKAAVEMADRAKLAVNLALDLFENYDEKKRLLL